MWLIEPSLALDLTARIAALGLALSGLEMIRLRPQWASAGVFAAAVVAPFQPRPGALTAFDRWLVPLLLLQTGGGLGLAALGLFHPVGRLLLAAGLGAALALRWRRRFGGDGAEQMSVIILIAAGLAALPVPSAGRIWLATLFITAQLCLAYMTAGIAKLISPLWRRGEALPEILSTYGHGHPEAAAFLQRNPNLAFGLSWSVILFESLFPLALLAPGWLAAGALLAGFAFHLGCAYLMGLNSFLWSFPATYPCLLALWLSLHY